MEKLQNVDDNWMMPELNVKCKASENRRTGTKGASHNAKFAITEQNMQNLTASRDCYGALFGFQKFRWGTITLLVPCTLFHAGYMYLATAVPTQLHCTAIPTQLSYGI